MKKPNEENALKALIEILERAKGTKYEYECSPDEENENDIDFILRSTSNRFDRIAVEHTILELYEGQLGYINKSYDLVEEINEFCRENIPTDRFYYLIVPQLLIGSLRKRKRKSFIYDCGQWITHQASKLMLDGITTREFGGHEVKLMCPGSIPELNGNVWRGPKLPENVDRLQINRFHKVIQTKLKKLMKYKIKGLSTILILEDIAGADYEQFKTEISFCNKVQLYLFVNYIVILRSNNERMIVGNVWKENFTWYSNVPENRKFSLHS